MLYIEWKHGVMREHIKNRRIALTMREPAEKFKSGELYEKYGKQLIERGLNFIPVSN